MSILPESTIIGVLEILEIYDFYDIPSLFSCKNNSGQIFIAIWIDETENCYDWLYAPVSSLRFELIRSQKIDLRNIFLESEDNFVFKIKVSKINEDTTLETVACKQLKEEWLPEANEFIELEAETISTKSNESLKQKSKSLRREIVKLTLDFSNDSFYAKNEAPLKEWGNILVSLQDFFDAIGQLKKGIPTANGGVSQEIKTESRFNVMAVSSGSFVTEIAAAEIGNLFNESLASEIAQEFIEVVSKSDNQEELTNIIRYFQLRAARKYRDFLIELQTARTQLSIDWFSPITNKGSSTTLKETTIQNAIIIIDQVESELPKIINVFGTLIGGNKRSEKFEIIDDDQKTYRGDISSQVINSSVNMTLDKKYEFIIEETKKLKPATDEVFYSYKLVGLKQRKKK